LAETYVRDGRQTLLYAAKRFHAWCDAAAGWVVVEDDAVMSFLWRAVSDRRWRVTPAHVRKLLASLRLELAWPPPTHRAGAEVGG
jgi:hypothetical protein